MKLKSVTVKLFRNVLNSTEVTIQPDVTCLVGKNESGKTSFLQALRMLNPAQGNVKFDVSQHYPAWLQKMHRMKGDELETVEAVTATFEIGDPDRSAFAKRFGDGVLKSTVVRVSRTYGDELFTDPEFDEQRALQNLLAGINLPKGADAQPKKAKTFAELASVAAHLIKQAEGDAKKAGVGESLKAALTKLLGEGMDFEKAAVDLFYDLIPKFFYYAEYSRLPGIVRIRELLEAKTSDLSVNQHTARSLLAMAGAEDDYLLNPNYETRKRELENVANAITHDVLKYWTTNNELRVLIDINQKTEQRKDGQHAVHDEMHVRMWDNRHMLSLPFGERSSGFQWFFSFLAAFSRYEYDSSPIIILLDEPGLGLHARAQNDFLRFIDERLAKRCQVIYSTHSPFMIQPGKLERARVVEDKGRETGSIITSDVLTSDPDTLFPLQGALGYDIAQNLLITQNNLIVEGSSDFAYLTSISDHLRGLGRASLDDRLSIKPVGGADTIPTFVALLGMHLDVTVLVDARKEGHQRLATLAQQGYLKATRIVTVGEVLGRKTADIEDLFEPADYLKLYNAAFSKTLTASALSGSDPIVRQIARLEGVDRFDHNKPADTFLRDKVNILSKLAEATLANFEKLFVRINSTISA